MLAAASAASGGRQRSRIHLGGRSWRAGCSLTDGSALVESAQAIGLAWSQRASEIRCGRRAEAWASSSPRCRTPILRRSSSSSVARRQWTAARGSWRCSAGSACRFGPPATCARPSLDAARIFAAQKGATPEQAAELERRLLEGRSLAPFRELPGAGAAGGLGAALAALGAELVEGARLVLDLLGFREPAGRRRPRRHRRGNGGPDDMDGQSAGRGRPPLRGARRALRALRRPCPRSAGRRRGLRAQRRSRAGARGSRRAGRRFA